MIRIVCPHCGIENHFEITKLLGARKYELQCLSCGKGFIVSGGRDELEGGEPDHRSEDGSPNRL